MVPLPEFEPTVVARLVEAMRYKPKSGGFDSRWWHWNFTLPSSFLPHYSPGIDSASSRNEYMRHISWGVKADNLATFMCRPSGKSGSLNVLEQFTSRKQKGRPLTTESTCLVFCVRYTGIAVPEHAITTYGCQGLKSRENHPKMNIN
jgi:hypothetical protein